MKLLPPKELNTKLQEQKKSEIDAGLFLARKIDHLREELADTQKTHDETILNLSKEMEVFVAEQTSQKGSILKEISELKEQRKLLQIPLDDEWQKVAKKAEDLEELSKILSARENKVLENETSNHKKDTELSAREEKCADTEQRVNGLLSTAERTKQEADKILTDAKEKEAFINQAIKIHTQEIEEREKSVAYREIDAENKWNNALAKEETNRKETLRIESKQRQIKNALEELKKHGKRS